MTKLYNNFKGISRYLSGTAVGSSGTAAVAAAPDRASSAFLTARGAAFYYDVNAGTASATSPGYVPDGSNNIILPIENLGSVAFFSSGGTIHVQWYQDF